MATRVWPTLSAAVISASLCGGCAVPRYDVPYPDGTPAVTSIVNRLQHELLEQVRDGARNQEWLLTGDYQVVASLSLEVNDTGGLAPSLSYLNPLNKLESFTFGGSGVLSESRDHNFTENLQFSLRQIYQDSKRFTGAYPPPPADTNLAGTLGVGDFVAMADSSPGLAEDRAAPNSVFGGSVQFLVTKSVARSGRPGRWCISRARVESTCRKSTPTRLRWRSPRGRIGASRSRSWRIRRTQPETFSFSSS
jgi:hypothetical protein